MSNFTGKFEAEYFYQARENIMACLLFFHPSVNSRCQRLGKQTDVLKMQENLRDSVATENIFSI